MGAKRFIWFFVLAVLLSVVTAHLSHGGRDSSKDEAGLGDKGKPLYGGVYRRGLGGEPITLDPARITDAFSTVVANQLFEGLVRYSDEHVVVPCLAEYWESSRDNLRWVFHIKKGVLFHNGRELTAEDFVYTFTRTLRPDAGSWSASLLRRIEGASEFMEGKADYVEGIRALDRSTLEIRLSEQFSPFIALLSMIVFGVIPKEEVERWGNDFELHPVGTGPFRFVKWDRSKEVVLKANEHYHEGRPYLDEVIFKTFPGRSVEEMFSEFEKGNLEDSLFPEESRERILKGNEYLFLHRPSLDIRFIIMNNSTAPFDDKRVRQAFNHAIDKVALSAEIGKGRYTPATGFIPPGMAGHDPDSAHYPYSPEKARGLLEEAGYPNGEGLPVIQFWSNVRSKTYLAEEEAIEKYLSAIGVKIEFNYETDWPTFKDMMAKGRLPMFRYGWSADIPDPDNIIGSLFHSGSQTNRSFYKNPEVDDLIEKAQKERDFKKRISLYWALQEMIMKDAPVILLSYRSYERVFQPYVRNFEAKALGDHYFSLERVWLYKQASD